MIRFTSSDVDPRNRHHCPDLKYILEKIMESPYDYDLIDPVELKRWGSVGLAAKSLNWAAKKYSIPVRVHIRKGNLYASKVKEELK